MPRFTARDREFVTIAWSASILFASALYYGTNKYYNSSHDLDICDEMKTLVNHTSNFCSKITANISCDLVNHTLDYFINMVNTTCINGTTIIHQASDNVSYQIDTFNETWTKGSIFLAGLATSICLTPWISYFVCDRRTSNENTEVTDKEKAQVVIEAPTPPKSKLFGWMSWCYRGNHKAATEHTPLVPSNSAEFKFV